MNGYKCRYKLGYAVPYWDHLIIERKEWCKSSEQWSGWYARGVTSLATTGRRGAPQQRRRKPFYPVKTSHNTIESVAPGIDKIKYFINKGAYSHFISMSKTFSCPFSNPSYYVPKEMVTIRLGEGDKDDLFRKGHISRRLKIAVKVLVINNTTN